MVVNTTALLACCNRTDMRSASCSASMCDCGMKERRESRMYIWPHLWTIQLSLNFYQNQFNVLGALS